MNKQGVSSRPENNDLGLRMRTCENCGVGLGTMDRGEWLERFVTTGEECPFCHKPVVVYGRKELEPFVSTRELAKKYAVSADDLVDMIHQDKFSRYETEEQTAGFPHYFLRESEVARLFPLREAERELVTV